MATISFWAGINDISINNLSASGIGFYGSSFGNSVAVGEYQQTTYITNAAGTTQGAQINNVKYLNPSSGYCNSQTSGTHLLNIPNYLSTLNIRFTHTTAVKTQNWAVRIYDRNSINNNPSGVTAKLAQIIHPNLLQDTTGSGDSTWTNIYGSGSILNLDCSPGMSGLYTGGVNTSDLRHDQYLAISCSPDSIGSKTFALWTQLEYL